MARGAPNSEITAGTGLARPRNGLDIATLFGLLGAFGVVAVAMVAGGTPTAFLDLPSFLIVAGGTVTVTAVSFSAADIATLSRNLTSALVRPGWQPRVVARQMLILADAARRTGVEPLRAVLPELRREPFLYRAVALIVDGLPPDEIQQVLTGEAAAAAAGQMRSVAILRRAAEVAPAMGLIGTLVGLVQMMGSLNNPAAIGPGMAVALLTTFYGAVLGNMVLTPLAGKLEHNAEADGLIRNLTLFGAVSIARQENPRRLEMLLNSVLPPGKRLQFFDRS